MFAMATYWYDPAQFIILVDVCANLLLEKSFLFKSLFHYVSTIVKLGYGLGWVCVYYITLFSCELVSIILTLKLLGLIFHCPFLKTVLLTPAPSNNDEMNQFNCFFLTQFHRVDRFTAIY